MINLTPAAVKPFNASSSSETPVVGLRMPSRAAAAPACNTA